MASWALKDITASKIYNFHPDSILLIGLAYHLEQKPVVTEFTAIVVLVNHY